MTPSQDIPRPSDLDEGCDEFFREPLHTSRFLGLRPDDSGRLDE